MPQGKTTVRKRWSREELLLAMNLYCRIPFGRQHSRAPEVVELAQALGRSASSVAMKLNNFTSLDPKETARGVRGLTGASKLDNQVWEEFHSNWDKLAGESEELWIRKVSSQFGDVPLMRELMDNSRKSKAPVDKISAPQTEPNGPTQGERMTKVRYTQQFFRRTVLTAYNVRCCISEIPVPELLIASHILPWNLFPEHRVDPRNGLCLSRLHDAAFDQGLLTFDERKRIVLSQNLKEYLPNNSLHQYFVVFEGCQIHMPEKFQPDSDFLRYHREKIFQK